jgi:hypothetical protein
MTATVFSSPEPDVVITPPGAPLMPMANPAIIRSAQGRRRPAWKTAAPIAAVAGLAVVGLLVVTHHKAPVARQVAEVAPAALSPAVPAPALVAAPVPVAAAPVARLAARSPAYAPIRHGVTRTRASAPNAPASAADVSATAPIVAQIPAAPVMPIAPIVAAPTPPAAPAADPMAPAAATPVTPAPDTPKVTPPQR